MLNFDISFIGRDFFRIRLRVGDLLGVNIGIVMIFLNLGFLFNDIVWLIEVYYIFFFNEEMSIYIGVVGFDFDLIVFVFNFKLISGNIGSLVLFFVYSFIIYI